MQVKTTQEITLFSSSDPFYIYKEWVSKEELVTLILSLVNCRDVQYIIDKMYSEVTKGE